MCVLNVGLHQSHQQTVICNNVDQSRLVDACAAKYLLCPRHDVHSPCCNIKGAGFFSELAAETGVLMKVLFYIKYITILNN